MEFIRKTKSFYIVEFEDGTTIWISIKSTKEIFANTSAEMKEIAMFQAILEYQRRVLSYGPKEFRKIDLGYIKDSFPILLRQYSINELINSAYEIKYYQWKEILESPNPCIELDKYR